MEKKIIIYGKDGCPYTDQARLNYGDKAEYIDVRKDPSKMQEMLKFSGGARRVPVIVEDGKATVGYGGS